MGAWSVTEDNRMPNFWWCPTHHLYRGGEQRPCADAVRLVPAPPAPRVFFPGDTVPAGVALANGLGQVLAASPFPYMISGGPGAAYVEVLLSTNPAWQATVDRARAERAEGQHTEGTNHAAVRDGSSTAWSSEESRSAPAS